MNTWTQAEIDAVTSKIYEKAMVDKEFRALALRSPNEAIKQLAGKDVPQGYTIKIIENGPGVDQTFVLPDFENEELSDNELDQVAGGRGASFCAAEACGLDAG